MATICLDGIPRVTYFDAFKTLGIFLILKNLKFVSDVTEILKYENTVRFYFAMNFNETNYGKYK